MTLVPVSRETALAVHDAAIGRFGGAPGIRDTGLLDAALASAWQTFDGQDLYPTAEEKAARLAFEIIGQHPFVDGNKRTAAALMRSVLLCDGARFRPRWKEWFDIIVDVGAGNKGYEDLLEFVKANASRSSDGGTQHI